MLPAYKATKRGELKSYRLDAVAEAELGENKIDHTGESIWEMWNENMDLLLRYNLHDVRLVVEIDRKANIIGFRRSIAHAVGSDLADAQNNNDFIEMMVRRKLASKNLVGPTARHEKKDAKYAGGHVHDAYCGLAKNVVGMDLESLYPMTMWMLNSSPEVRVDESFDGPVAVAPNGARFRLDKTGLFTELVDEALDLKAEAKAARNAATDDDERKKLSEEYDVRKTIVNSLYGVIGWEHFFLYDELTAEAVTTMGQTVIKETSSFLDSQEVSDVIYGDTDSSYVQFPESWEQDHVLEAAGRFRRELNERVYPKLAESWGMGDRECRWNIEVESFAPTFFQYGKKKKYAMHVTWKDGKPTDTLKIVGMHSNRSDVAEFTEVLQKKVLESILGVRDEPVAEIVYAAGKELSMGRDLESMGIPTAIGKPIHEYSESTIQRKVAEFSNAVLKTNFDQGSKPKRVYVQPGTITGYPSVDVLGFEDAEEFPDDLRIDSGRMIQTLIVNPLSPVLEAVDIDPDAALKGQTQSSLSSFF
jgi:DNA polymerase I